MSSRTSSGLRIERKYLSTTISKTKKTPKVFHLWSLSYNRFFNTQSFRTSSICAFKGGSSFVIISHIIDTLIPKYSCAILFLRPKTAFQSTFENLYLTSSGIYFEASPIISRFLTTASIVFLSELKSFSSTPSIYFLD